MKAPRNSNKQIVSETMTLVWTESKNNKINPCILKLERAVIGSCFKTGRVYSASNSLNDPCSCGHMRDLHKIIIVHMGSIKQAYTDKIYTQDTIYTDKHENFQS